MHDPRLKEIEERDHGGTGASEYVVGQRTEKLTHWQDADEVGDQLADGMERSFRSTRERYAELPPCPQDRPREPDLLEPDTPPADPLHFEQPEDLLGSVSSELAAAYPDVEVQLFVSGSALTVRGEVADLEQKAGIVALLQSLPGIDGVSDHTTVAEDAHST